MNRIQTVVLFILSILSISCFAYRPTTQQGSFRRAGESLQ
jgi:hypothetical protein